MKILENFGEFFSFFTKNKIKRKGRKPKHILLHCGMCNKVYKMLNPFGWHILHHAILDSDITHLRMDHDLFDAIKFVK